MNYSDMTDEQISELVISTLIKNGVFTDDAREVSHRDYVSDGWNWGRGIETGWMTGRDGQLFITHQNGHRLNYCNSWADAGPIIESNRISVSINFGDWVASDENDDFAIFDGNPKRAAMIVFLMMQEAA